MSRQTLNEVRTAYLQLSEKMDNLLADSTIELLSWQERAIIFSMAELSEVLLLMSDEEEPCCDTT